ncbi:MAG: hypothetical protein K1X94_24540 [Sandaracinaceae bacterium]|nr:hypothetical protein [Sandaracinaceae bacterium]
MANGADHGRVWSSLFLGLAAVLGLGCAPRASGGEVATSQAALVTTADSLTAPTRLGSVRAGETVTGAFAPATMYLSWTFEVRAAHEPVDVSVDATYPGRLPMLLQLWVYRATAEGNPTGTPLALPTRGEPWRPHYAAELPRGLYVVVVSTADLATHGSVRATVVLPTLGLPCGSAGDVTCDAETQCERPACGAPGICRPLPRCESADGADESAYVCGCDGAVHWSACLAQREGGGVAYPGLCRPLVGPISASRDTAMRPTPVGVLRNGTPQRASFSPTSRFLAWTIENVRPNTHINLSVRYLPVYHETEAPLLVSLYRATETGLPTGTPWAAPEPASPEILRYQIGGTLAEVGTYVVVIRGGVLRTSGTVEASLDIATLGQACGTTDSVACDQDSYCARPDGVCGGPGVCRRNPSCPVPTRAAAVCGCDDVTYPSACDARLSDMPVAVEAPCTEVCRVVGCGTGETCTYRPLRDVFECALVAPRGPVCNRYRMDPGCAGHPPLASSTGV